MTIIFILVASLLFFILSERFRAACGQKMLIDRLIEYLENIYRRTALKEEDEADIKDFCLSDRIVVRQVSFHQDNKD